MNLDPIKTAYFAGLLDGEGCFYLHKKDNGVRPVVQLNMTCEHTVRATQQHFGRGTVRPKKVSNLNGAPQWIWRVYYFDALFRRERPQKGRQRQFHQFGAEAIGSPNPEQDAEIITLAYNIYKKFNIQDMTVRLNSIGNAEKKTFAGIWIKSIQERGL